MRRQAVFLDRDGVLVEPLVRGGRAVAPTTLEDFQLVRNAADHVHRLQSAGLLCCVVTNQPEVARGILQPLTLDAMHAVLRAALPVDDIFVCPHDVTDGCDCRKPLPGLLILAATRWSIDLQGSVMVGDRWSDVAVGRAVGCRTVLLERPYSAVASSTDSVERARRECGGADVRAHDLAGAVDAALALI